MTCMSSMRYNILNEVSHAKADKTFLSTIEIRKYIYLCARKREDTTHSLLDIRAIKLILYYYASTSLSPSYMIRRIPLRRGGI